MKRNCPPRYLDGDDGWPTPTARLRLGRLLSSTVSRVVLVALLATSGRLPAAEEPTVALPPFLVEEIAKGPPWRYAESLGYEILSRCDDSVTRRVVEAHHQLHLLLAEILPPQLQVAQSVPKILVLYDQELQPKASQEVIARMLRDAPDLTAEPPEPPVGPRGFRVPLPSAPRRYSFLPNVRLWDRDAMAVLMIVRRDDFDPDRLALTYDYIGYLIRGRVPTLPLWFVGGFLELYQDASYEGLRLSVKPLEWLSEAHTTALKDPKTVPAVQSLPDFFAGRFQPAEAIAGVEPFRAWMAQAELLVRWGLDERGGNRRAEFFKFVERAAIEGVTERLFQEHFGVDFAAGREQLVAYLRTAVQGGLRFQPERRPKIPAWQLRNASDLEVARIKGDLERLEVPYVRELMPDLVPKYREQARRTLMRAYARDHRDARLLAIMGLCEVDAGNEAAAREYLEAAAQIGPIRPRANYELAKLRLAEVRAKPGGSEGRLSATQAAHVLTPLFAARADLPPLPEVYELIAEVWSHGSARPTRGHLAVLDEGVRLFPRRSELAMRAAELNLRHGYRDEAAALAEIAARTAVDEAMRERVGAVKAQLKL